MFTESPSLLLHSLKKLYSARSLDSEICAISGNRSVTTKPGLWLMSTWLRICACSVGNPWMRTLRFYHPWLLGWASPCQKSLRSGPSRTMAWWSLQTCRQQGSLEQANTTSLWHQFPTSLASTAAIQLQLLCIQTELRSCNPGPLQNLLYI